MKISKKRAEILKDWLEWESVDKEDICPFNERSCFTFCKKFFNSKRASSRNKGILTAKEFAVYYGECRQVTWHNFHVWHDCPCVEFGQIEVMDRIEKLLKENKCI